MSTIASQETIVPSFICAVSVRGFSFIGSRMPTSVWNASSMVALLPV
ncbi:MAG: hypothetical protein IT337_05440 [Thermomicrobiales bacterium]|nr:hypothetical protein [Thermomicrobiales bacterium]